MLQIALQTKKGVCLSVWCGADTYAEALPTCPKGILNRLSPGVDIANDGCADPYNVGKDGKCSKFTAYNKSKPPKLEVWRLDRSVSFVCVSHAAERGWAFAVRVVPLGAIRACFAVCTLYVLHARALSAPLLALCPRHRCHGSNVQQHLHVKHVLSPSVCNQSCACRSLR